MTPTNEDLLALAKIICAAMNGPSEYGWDDQSDLYRGRCLDAARCAIVAERQAIRDKALEDAAMCCEAEADKCDDAVKWGGAPKYIANCKAASYAMRDRAYAIREMKGKPE